jgi:hypothetical protein
VDSPSNQDIFHDEIRGGANSFIPSAPMRLAASGSRRFDRQEIHALSCSVTADAHGPDWTANDRDRRAANAHGAVWSGATGAIDATRADYGIGVSHRRGHGSDEQAKGQSGLHQIFHGYLPCCGADAD